MTESTLNRRDFMKLGIAGLATATVGATARASVNSV